MAECVCGQDAGVSLAACAVLALPCSLVHAGKDGEQHFGVLIGTDEKRAMTVAVDGGGKPYYSGEQAVEMFLPPVESSPVFAIGLNYKKHVAETGKTAPEVPVVTMKAASSLTGHQTAIVIPRIASSPPEVDFEGALLGSRFAERIGTVGCRRVRYDLEPFGAVSLWRVW